MLDDFNKGWTGIEKLIMFAVLLVVGTAATFTAFSLAPVQRIGPFFTTPLSFDTLSGNQSGGVTRVYKAKLNDTLKVGDAVYINAAGTVDKSATITNYNKAVGIVVGGSKTSMQAYSDSASVGTTAAIGTTVGSGPGNLVIILREGRTWVNCDSVAAGIAPGALIQASTYTAGKIQAAPAKPDSFFRVMGRMVDSGVASTKCLAEIVVHH